MPELIAEFRIKIFFFIFLEDGFLYANITHVEMRKYIFNNLHSSKGSSKSLNLLLVI